MRYTLSIQESHYEALTAHLFPDREFERAAYLLCSLSSSPEETRLLVQEVVPVAEEHIDDSSDEHMTIDQPSYLRALKKAARGHQCFVFVHSHLVITPATLLRTTKRSCRSSEPPMFAFTGRMRSTRASYYPIRINPLAASG